MSSPLQQNTVTIQNLLNAINELPNASGGIDLPELTNPGTAGDLLSGKELIDGGGNVITGTIATKTASNLTASGATVTVPAGYYASQVTKSVATATQATPSISINSTGKITASAAQTAGYVSAGTKSGTKQMTTQAAKTVTPSESSQTAVAKNVYTTGAVTVGAIPSGYLVDSEVTTQTNLISQIKTALEGKAAGGSGSGGSVISVDVSLTGVQIFYWGSDGVMASTSTDGTILALDGIIFFYHYANGIAWSASGEYSQSYSLPYQSLRFLSNGGTLSIYTNGGGGAD